MNRYFTHLSTGQVKMIEEGVCHKFKGQKQPKEEPMEPYSYEKAIERYKLALYNTLVKKGKNSEKAYECLKISWLYRGWIEELSRQKRKMKKHLPNAGKKKPRIMNRHMRDF